MKRLYATTDPIEAQLFRARLRDAGIESSLDNEGSADYAIGLPTSAVPLGITVSDEDATAAAEILSHHLAGQDEGEPDPEAPPPLSPEESLEFEEKVRRGATRMRWRLALLYLLPGLLGGAALASAGEWESALGVAGTAGAIVAFVWFVNLLAERKENGPAPR